MRVNIAPMSVGELGDIRLGAEKWVEIDSAIWREIVKALAPNDIPSILMIATELGFNAAGFQSHPPPNSEGSETPE